MNSEQSLSLGQLIRERRHALGLGLQEVADRAGMNKSSLIRIEYDRRAAPQPDTLTNLARVLQLSVADLFTLAGYSTPQDLPSLRPYLRTKYGELPPEALAEIEDYLARFGGYGTGPADGEDEQPD